MACMASGNGLQTWRLWCEGSSETITKILVPVKEDSSSTLTPENIGDVMVENTCLWRLVSDKLAKRSVSGPRRDLECLQRFVP